MEKNYVKINLYNFYITFATHLLYCMYSILMKIISYEEDVMKKTLKYSVMTFVTALLFVFVSACNNTNANTQADANNNDVVKASYDRSAVEATKADFTLAQSKVKEKSGTDKETCFSCHTGVSELHTRGVHKDLDCTNCHFDITKEHTENPTPENRPKVNMNWEACGQCHDNQMHSFLQVGQHRPARFEKSNFNGRSPNPAWDKLMAPYGFTKAAINSMVQGLAYLFISQGIRINAVAPGVTASDMTGLSSDGNLYLPYNATERVYLPEEVAETACFLLSDASGCISGQVIVCNNGKTINARWK